MKATWMDNLVAAVCLAALLVTCAGCPVTQTSPPGDILKLTEPKTDTVYYVYAPTDHSQLKAMPLAVTLT